ncbi:MAG: Rieske 2Fe-2S domain-containing protein, partial [Blastomonas fulva]
MAEADPKLPIPFKVVEADRIPSQRYYDEAFYKLECENLWPHVWQMACRTEQLPNVGDWIEYSNLGQSVIVVRTSKGIRAFHNACRHRGLPLTEAGGHGNCKTAGFI